MELKDIKEVAINYGGKTTVFEQMIFVGFFMEKGVKPSPYEDYSDKVYTIKKLNEKFNRVGAIVHVIYNDGTETEYTIENR